MWKKRNETKRIETKQNQTKKKWNQDELITPVKVPGKYSVSNVEQKKWHWTGKNAEYYSYKYAHICICHYTRYVVDRWKAKMWNLAKIVFIIFLFWFMKKFADMKEKAFRTECYCHSLVCIYSVFGLFLTALLLAVAYWYTAFFCFECYRLLNIFVRTFWHFKRKPKKAVVYVHTNSNEPSEEMFAYKFK